MNTEIETIYKTKKKLLHILSAVNCSIINKTKAGSTGGARGDFQITLLFLTDFNSSFDPIFYFIGEMLL